MNWCFLKVYFLTNMIFWAIGKTRFALLMAWFCTAPGKRCCIGLYQ